MKNFLKDDLAHHKKLAMRAVVEQGLLSDDNPLVALMHKQGIKNSITQLQKAFPSNFNHCFAVKANPYLNFLKLINEYGMGAEVASAAELELALLAGFSKDQMVFDAPVKTLQEIDRALSLGIAFNIDNFQELERVVSWFDTHQINHSKQSSIGFRINPQIGAGSVEATSTATRTSKFGIGIKDSNNRKYIIDACKQYKWITCIHVHVGSIGCPLELMCEGIKVAIKLAEEINELIGKQQITHLDMGGGLPVDFSQENESAGFSEYAGLLQTNIPHLFDGTFQVTTEFGRAIAASNAITIGRVEYTKSMGDIPIALTHIGVQTLLRTVNEPEVWERRISAFDSSGNCKDGDLIEQNIGGPACFSGDLIARQRPLPLLEPNDYVMVHDTGAYHFSNHYQYNALPRVPVYAYDIDESNNVAFEIISSGQRTKDVIDDYS